MNRIAFASYDPKSSMLAVWLDKPPVGDDPIQPAAWATQTAGSDFEVERLCELAHAPSVSIRNIDGSWAERWHRTDRTARSRASKARRDAAVEAQTGFLIASELEAEGRHEGMNRRLGRGLK